MKSSLILSLATLTYAASVARRDHGTSDDSSHAAVNCRNNICYSAVVPEATAKSGSGAVYFQIYAPTTFAWVAMGTGSSMADSNIFVIYQDGKGNVTLSNRQTTGHTMPQVPENGGAKTQLLAGSGVSNGVMVANFRCDNCGSWKQNEALDFSAKGTPMIGAWQQGDSLDSTDVDARIGKHTGSPRIFSLDLSKAQVSTAGNPFVGDHAIPAPLSENTTEAGGNGGDAGGNGGSAGVGRSALLSSSVALAVLFSSLSLFL